jgi:hypothetical protein
MPTVTSAWPTRAVVLRCEKYDRRRRNCAGASSVSIQFPPLIAANVGTSSELSVLRVLVVHAGCRSAPIGTERCLYHPSRRPPADRRRRRTSKGSRRLLSTSEGVHPARTARSVAEASTATTPEVRIMLEAYCARDYKPRNTHAQCDGPFETSDECLFHRLKSRHQERLDCLDIVIF